MQWWMLTWAGFIELSHTKNYVTFRNFKFRSLELYRFSKIVNSDTDRIFPIPFKVLYISLRYYSSKDNSGVHASIYLQWVGKKILLHMLFCFFSKLKVLLWYVMKNPLLSKSALKYLVCYQVFWMEVRRLQDQCKLIHGHCCFITAFQTTCNAKKLVQMYWHKIGFSRNVFWQNMNFSI